jgi:hypothetical protein
MPPGGDEQSFMEAEVQTRKKSGEKPTERRILLPEFAGIDKKLAQLRQEARLAFHWYPAQSGQVEIHTPNVEVYDQLCDILSATQMTFVTRLAYQGPSNTHFT